jgi:hypothetical protein
MPVYNGPLADYGKTRKQLRDDLMRRLGYGAQVNNPPPGMADLLNSFLAEAQELLHARYTVLRTERTYAWPLEAGQRFYALEDGDDGAATRLDPLAVTWVGIVDEDGQWRPLRAGIDPTLYSHEMAGRPERYVIRDSIEVWPVPDESAGEIAVRGHFGLAPFDDDSDATSVDPRAVFLLALANAKAHYRHPDAGNYTQQLEVYVDNIVAGSHQTRRYVPGYDRRADFIYTAPRPTEPFPS